MIQGGLSGTNGSKPQFTFVLNDAGETKALLPVMKRLDWARINYSILANGTAKSLLNGNPHVAPLPNDILVLSQIAPYEAAQAQSRFNQALEAPCAIVGLASQFQTQWARYFKSMGKKVVGYYDSFNYDTVKNKVDKFMGLLTHLITPSQDTAWFLKQRFSNIPVIPLGQPTLESIQNTLHKINPAWLAQQLGIDPQKPTVLFVGGAGPGYEEAFSTFCQATQNMLHSNFLVSLHPKVTGQTEQRLLQQWDPAGRIRIVPRNIRTNQVLSIAHAVVSQDSTMNVQALFQGKKVLMVGPAQSNFNPVTVNSLAERYRTSDSLTQGLIQTLESIASGPYYQPSILHSVLGIPIQATEKITEFLIFLVNQSQPNHRISA